MNPEITEPEEAAPQSNAVSIFGQGGSPNDFPVLKAFQEYIDAEQAKARKRMLGLSVFFILLLVVIIVTFTVVVMSVINRNQSLSDRLLDIALREKVPAQPVVNVQSPAPAPVVQPVVQQPSQEDTLKPVVEEIGKLTAALVKVQQQPVPVPQPTPVVVTTSPQPVVQPAAESAELVRLREELRREREERKAEKEAKEKEEKRQAEIEAHRRRLYPEYYAQQDARKAAGTQPRRTDEPVPAEPVTRPVEPMRRAPTPLPAPAPQPVAPVAKPAPQPVAPIAKPAPQPVAPIAKPAPQPVAPVAKPEPQPAPVPAMKPRSYFSETDEDPELKELLNRLPPPKPQPPAPQPVAKPAPQPVAKPEPQPVAKPAPQPVAKPAPQPVAKPAPQQVAPPPSKPVSKPIATPEATPAVHPPVQQENKTETLTIGGADGKSIPWLIEIPQN